jgi:MtN3 and saliva related transmembrane protein
VTNNLELVGYAAAIFTTTSFVPQAVKILKNHDTRSISLSMYAMFTMGVALWLVYGLTLRSPPIILANAVTLLLSGTILILKLKNP